MRRAKPIRLVEDDSVDMMTIKRALKEVGAAGYMMKLADYSKFIRTIRTIDSYWTLGKLQPDGD